MKKKANETANIEIPFISYGIIKEGGFFISLPVKGISLNSYKQLHFGKITQLRNFYKSIIDIILVSCIKANYFKFDDTGIHLIKSLFKNRIDVEWALTFKVNLVRDPSNFVQKIMLDAVTDTGIIKDDSELFVKSDKVFFMNKVYDSISCLMLGELNKPMLRMKYLSIIKYQDILNHLDREML